MRTRHDLSTYVKHDNQIETNKYFKYITELLDVIEKRFPKGAVNRFDVASTLLEDDLVTYLTTLQQFDAVTKKIVGKTNIDELVNLMKSISYFNCEIVASYAQGYMLNKYPNISAEVVYVDQHCQLVLGRNQGSKPDDIRTWGNEALLLDFWAKNACLAKDFLTLQKKLPDVSYCLKVLDANTGLIKKVIKSTAHYLEGTPKVYTGQLSSNYDKMYCLWVEKDQALQNKISIPVISISPLVANSIYTKPFPEEILKKYKLANADQTSLEQGLRRATFMNNLEDLKLFIAYVNDINAQDSNPKSQKTALHIAFEKGHQSCFDLLIESGARMNIRNAKEKKTVVELIEEKELHIPLDRELGF
jgi:hypothetical protein